MGCEVDDPGGAPRARPSWPSSAPGVRRPQPRDEGAGRRRARPRAGRSDRATGWRCSTRRWRWRAAPPTTRAPPPSRSARSSPPATSRPTSSASGDGPTCSAATASSASAPPGPAFLSSHCDSVQATLLMELGRWTRGRGAPPAGHRRLRGGRWVPALAPRHRARRPPHPPGPPGRRRGAAPRQGPVDAGAPARGPPPPRPGRPRPRHRRRPDGGCAASAPTGCARSSCSPRSSTPTSRPGDLDAAHAACDDLRARTEGLDVPGLEARAMRRAGPPARGRRATSTGPSTCSSAAARRGRRPPAAVAPRHPPDRAGSAPRRRPATGRGPRRPPRRRPPRSRPSTSWSPPRTLALLRPAGHGRSTSDRTAVVAELSRATARWWSASCAGTTVRLRDTKGLRYLAELIGTPGRERHALDLVDRVEGVDAAGGLDRRSLGDAGEVLDGAARTAYRHRIEALRAEADDALADGPPRRGRGLPGGARPARAAARPGVRPRGPRAAWPARRPSGPASTSPGRCGRRWRSSSRPCRSRAPRSTGGSAPASTAPTSRVDGEVRWIVQS